MKNSTFRSRRTLLTHLAFTGLSAEQSLLATLVSQNPATNPRVRQRAKSLLLLDGGASTNEVMSSTTVSRRSLTELIHRLRSGGLCAALLGAHASRERRAWLTLSPWSVPQVNVRH